MHPLTDNELMTRIAAKDGDALLELFRRYKNIAYRFDYMILQNAADTEEAIQEKFYRIWRKADQYENRPGSTVSNYILKIDKRICLDMLRKNSRKKEILLSDLYGNQDISEVDFESFIDFIIFRNTLDVQHLFDNMENRDLALRILEFTKSRFSKKHYICFWDFIKGHSYKEISKEQNLSLNSVRGYITRGYQMIRRNFSEERQS